MPSPQLSRTAKPAAVPRPAAVAVRTGATARPSPGAALLGLQRRHGNRYLQRMIAAGTSPASLAGLGVGPADDQYEREADRVALRALGTPVPAGAGGPGEAAPRSGAGKPLPVAFRQRMEAALGTDLGDVRLHRGAPADMLNDSLRARAFTAGSDIYLRGTEPGPGSPVGQRLLAHELAHVVQQRHLGPRIQRAQVGYKLETEDTDDVALVKKFFSVAKQLEKERKAAAQGALEKTEAYSTATGTFGVGTTAFKTYQKSLPTIGLTEANFTKTGFPVLKASVIERLNKDKETEQAKALGTLELVGNELRLGSGSGAKTVATMLLGKAAFAKKGKADRDIYTKEGSDGKEYVLDDRGIFTRRYAWVEKADYQVRSLIRRKGRLSGQYQEKQRWLKRDEDERALSAKHGWKHYGEDPSYVTGLTARKGGGYTMSLSLLAQLHQELGSGVHQRGVSLRSTSKEIYGNAGESFWRKGGVLIKVDLAKAGSDNTLINHYGPGGVKEATGLPTIKGRKSKHYAESVTKNREIYLKYLDTSMFVSVTYHKDVVSGKRVEETPATVPETEKEPRKYWLDYLKGKVGYDSYRSGYLSRGATDLGPVDSTKDAQYQAGYRARGKFWRGFKEGRKATKEPTIDHLGWLQTEKQRTDPDWTAEFAYHGWDYAQGYVRGYQYQCGHWDGYDDAKRRRRKLTDTDLKTKGKHYADGYRAGYASYKP